MLVDVHCHIHFKNFDEDRDEVIKRAKKNNVSVIIASGTEYDTNKQVLELAKKYDMVKASLGIYPTYVESLSDKELQRDIDFIKKNKDNIISIGEIGADFHHTSDEKLQQKQVIRLKKIITTLQPLNKPFVIHSRKAELTCIEVLEELKVKKVLFHCFTGNHKLAKRIEDNGWYLSIPPNIVRSSHFQGIVNRLSINSILTETDAPYLAPQQTERNEPSFVTFAIKKIAEIKKLTQEEVAKNIFLNYQKLFS